MGNLGEPSASFGILSEVTNSSLTSATASVSRDRMASAPNHASIYDQRQEATDTQRHGFGKAHEEKSTHGLWVSDSLSLTSNQSLARMRRFQCADALRNTEPQQQDCIQQYLSVPFTSSDDLQSRMQVPGTIQDRWMVSCIGWMYGSCRPNH